MINQEELLDQYIDNLNEGNRTRPALDDSELTGLFQTAEAVSQLREPDWPAETFARDLAGNLSTRLTPDRNGHSVLTGDHAGFQTHAANPWVGPIEPQSKEPGRVRRTIQTAGALAAFSIFALVLVFVFREVSDDGFSLGAAPEDESPVNQLAYSSSSSGNQEIYLINADGSGQVQLTDHPAADTWPAWSPDGTKIAFVSDRGGSPQVWVMDADGSDINQVTDGTGEFAAPQWSPDGTRIAALRDEAQTSIETNPELWVFNADGSNARSLTAGHGVASAFEWSPDSREIAISIGLSGRGDRILLYDVTTGDVRALNDSDAFQSQPSWSPDGLQIAVAEATRTGADTAKYSVVIADVTGGGSKQVSSHLGFANIHDWSANGQYISVSSSDSADNSGLFVIPLENPEASQYLMGTTRYDLFAQWSPDSEQLAFLRQTGDQTTSFGLNLMVINVAGGDPALLATDIDMTSPPAWRPIPPTDPDDESQFMELLPTITTVTDEALPMGSPTVTPISSSD